VKRGKLSQTVDVDDVAAAATAAATRKSKKVSTNQKKKTTSDTAANISPALAEWMAQQEQQSSSSKESNENNDDDDDTTTSSSTASSSSSSKNKRPKRPGRIKQSARKAAEDARDERMESWVKEFKEVLEEGKSVDDIVSHVQELVTQLPTGNFKQLSASAQSQDFRLAWVGSDDAVTHIGTGLHNVPLARLQEVFLSFVGRNRVEIQEVIRILGPFPNVKNTLLGQSTFTRGDDNILEWTLTWDSMVDGTGKEILAGKEENRKRVDLHVYFSSPSVVVAVVPPNSENTSVYRSNPWENQGQHVLVFVREDNLLDELEKLRVA
jgi:hypothetical protein